MWGSLIGVVEQEDVSDVPRFSYDPSFQRSGIEVSPLVMPLSARVFSFPSLNEESFHRLPGLLADSLPDKFGTRLIERYLSDRGRTLSSLTAVERLCYTGSRGMGALEYVPSLRFSDTKDGTVDVEALIRLASDVLNERESMHIGDSGQMMEQQRLLWHGMRRQAIFAPDRWMPAAATDTGLSSLTVWRIIRIRETVPMTGRIQESNMPIL